MMSTIDTSASRRIDKLVGELQMARNYLQSEGERVRQMMARYIHLADTASASVKIIANVLLCLFELLSINQL